MVFMQTELAVHALETSTHSSMSRHSWEENKRKEKYDISNTYKYNILNEYLNNNCLFLFIHHFHHLVIASSKFFPTAWQLLLTQCH